MARTVDRIKSSFWIGFWIAEAFWFWACFIASGFSDHHLAVFVMLTLFTYICTAVMRRAALIGHKVRTWSDSDD